MRTSARNLLVPRLPTVFYAGERYWPVKRRHFLSGTTRWIYFCEDKASVKSVLEETLADETK